jgi:hypothetical protein
MVMSSPSRILKVDGTRRLDGGQDIDRERPSSYEVTFVRTGWCRVQHPRASSRQITTQANISRSQVESDHPPQGTEHILPRWGAPIDVSGFPCDE